MLKSWSAQMKPKPNGESANICWRNMCSEEPKALHKLTVITDGQGDLQRLLRAFRNALITIFMQTVTCCYLFTLSRQRIKYFTLFRAALFYQPRLTRRRRLRKSREGTFPNSLTVTIPAFRPSPPKFANFFFATGPRRWEMGDEWDEVGGRDPLPPEQHQY